MFARIHALTLVTALHLLIIGACPAWAVPSPDNYDRAYDQAVADARSMNYGVTTRLTPISTGNPELVWENDVPGSRVLMATMVSKWVYDSFYAGNEGKDVTLPRDVLGWVTVFPELKNFPAGPDANMRYKQLLGLDPDWSFDKVIEIWVRPEDMFRPSPDPEIDDSTADPGFGDNSPASPRPVNEDGTARPYAEWFEWRKAHCYTGSDAVPWTGTGYTYDWGRDGTFRGLSEFVILQGSTIGVYSVSDIADYHGGESGGCMINPSAGIAFELFFFPLAGAAAFLIRRKRR